MAIEFANSSDEIRLVIQARDPKVWKLPWHVWDLLEEYEIAIGYSLPEFILSDADNQAVSRSSHVRILAVLGDKKNIDIKPDREAIRALNGAAPLFMHQPRSQDFLRTLRQKNGWDILFFAGHSHTESATGRIFINEKESLRLDEFKNALKEAIGNGLKIAIFNSCDGERDRSRSGYPLDSLLVLLRPVNSRVVGAFSAVSYCHHSHTWRNSVGLQIV